MSSCLLIFPQFFQLGVSQTFLYLDQPCHTQPSPLFTSTPVGLSGWKVFQLTQRFRNVNMHKLLLSHGCLLSPLYVTWHQGNKRVSDMVSKIFSHCYFSSSVQSTDWGTKEWCLGAWIVGRENEKDIVSHAPLRNMLLSPGGVNPPTSITAWRELVKMAPLGALSFGVHYV